MSIYEYISPSQLEEIGFKDKGNRLFSMDIDENLLLHVSDEKTHYVLSLIDTFDFKLVELPLKLASFELIHEAVKSLTPEMAWHIHKKYRATFYDP